MTIGTPRRPSLRMPRGVVKSGTMLLDQQLWCWGRDIVARNGNLLVDYGAERVPAPPESEAGSLYILRTDRKTTIVLRGFGVFCGRRGEGSIFLHRFEFKPRLFPGDAYPRDAFEPDQLPPLRRPTTEREFHLTLSLCGAVAEACAGYESFVIAHRGVGYRRAVVRRWGSLGKFTIAAELMAETWKELARRLDTPTPIQAIEAVGLRRFRQRRL
jgi:hypothetical protein